MSDPEDHDELADELTRETEQMDQRSADLEGEIEGAREDWKAKRRDRDVPGAPPPEGEES